MGKAVARAYDRFLDATGLFAGLCIAAIAIGVSLDVALRYFGAGNLPWVPELSEYDLFVFTFVGAPWVLREGAHVRVDILVAGLPPRAAAAAEIVGDLVGFLVSAGLLYFGYLAFEDAFVSGVKIYKTVTLSEWWLLTLIPLSSCLLCIEFLRRIVRALKDGAQVRSSGASGL
jgi:TRAP-type C4-dicarboxylate transport system permease small subunit